MKRYGLFFVGFCALALAGQSQCPCEDKDRDGYCVEDGDCDDTNASIHPGAPEVCDGIDNNCDGIACVTQG